ncbi:MAG: HYR domain-containing protein, partial [Saprospiraceae bacterium]|nr:HYR domain-containing protein [Saprospiraceae bacterium]
MPGDSINSITGEFYFVPVGYQVGVVCIKVEEFRAGVKIGEVTRDLQIAVVACNANNNTPVAATPGPNPMPATVNQQVCMNITISDPDTDMITVVYNNGIPTGTFTPPLPVGPFLNYTGVFCFTPVGADLNLNRFFTLWVADDNCPVPFSNTYTFDFSVGCDTPMITCPMDIIVATEPFACDASVTYPDPMVTSDCMFNLTQIEGLTSGSPFPIGTTVNTFVASTGPLKNDTCSFSITVLENGQSQSLQSTAKRAAAGLACQDHVNISLSSDCQRVITARDVLLTGSAGCIDRYNCEVFIPGSLTPIPGATLTYEHVGQTLTYVVEDIQSGGKCWGTLKLEDKLGPQIYCQNDTISCLQMSEREDLVVITDLCQPFPTTTDILEKQWTDLGCDDREFIGYLARKVRATDVWGNYAECRDTLFVRKETIDSLVCGPDTLIECTTEVVRNGKTVELLWNTGKNGDTYLDAQGYAHPWPTKGDGYFPAPYLKSTQSGQAPGYLIPVKTDAGPDFTNTGKCQIVFDYEDHVVPTCGRSYKIRRTWHIYDWCGQTDTTCVQWFKITDTEAPVIKEAYLNPIDDHGGTSCEEVPASLNRLAREKGALVA